MSQNLPATRQLSILTREISELNDRLRPAPDDFIAERIGFLVDAGLAFPSSMAMDKAMPIYCFALAGIPAYGIAKAAEKLVKGEISGIPLGLIPKPPEFADLARTEAKHLVEHRLRLNEQKRTVEETVRPSEADRSPEVMARVRARLNQFKRDHHAQKLAERGIDPHPPLSDERAEFLRRLQELPDAPSVTAEQHAFRRRVASDLHGHTPEAPPKAADEIAW